MEDRRVVNAEEEKEEETRSTSRTIRDVCRLIHTGARGKTNETNTRKRTSK